MKRLDDKDVLRVLGAEDGAWFIGGCRIAFSGSTTDDWQRKCRVENAISDAIAKGEIAPIPESEIFIAPRISVISDDLGKDGVFNPANGKRYDSKSAYYRAVKDAGCEIMGNDAPTTMATPNAKEIDWRPAVAEALQQTSFSNQ